MPRIQMDLISKLHWGSEIWTSLDFEWSKKGWVVNGLDFNWDLKAQPFENQTNGCHFAMVRTIAIATAPLFENLTIGNPTFKKFRFQILP